MSNTIYSAKKPPKKFNYVYLITNKVTNMKYIGSRCCNIEPIKDLKKYKSSTKDKEFKQDQKNNPQNYLYEILSLHDTRKLATKEEARLHAIYDVKNNLEYYNRSNQKDNGFDTSGKTVVKDKNGCTLQVAIDDPQFLSGELIHVVKGKAVVRDKYNNILQVDIDDPQFLSGELVGVNKDYVVVKDEFENILRVSIYDENYISGKYKSIILNKVVVKDEHNNILMIDKNNVDYINGKYKSIHKNMVAVKDKNGKSFKVDINDPMYLSGDLVGVNTGKAVAKDKNNKIFRVDKGDPRFALGEIISNSAYWIKIDDTLYSCKIVEQMYNITRATVYNRCRSSDIKWSNWTII